MKYAALIHIHGITRKRCFDYLLLFSALLASGCSLSYNIVCIDASTRQPVVGASVTSFNHGYDLWTGPVERISQLDLTDSAGRVHVPASRVDGGRTLHLVKNGYWPATALIPDNQRREVFVSSPEPEPLMGSGRGAPRGGVVVPDTPEADGTVRVYLLQKPLGFSVPARVPDRVVRFMLIDSILHKPLPAITLLDRQSPIKHKCNPTALKPICVSDSEGIITLPVENVKEAAETHHCLRFEGESFKSFDIIVNLVGRSMYVCDRYPGNLIAVYDTENVVKVSLEPKTVER